MWLPNINTGVDYFRHDGQIQDVAGNVFTTSKSWRESVEEGKWAALEPEPVDVPAAYALMNGVWYRVKEGVRGLLVRTWAGEPVVYLVCESSTRYYRVMTRADWMPVLIDEVI